MPLETMLRICFMRHWYGLSDPAMEDALYEIEWPRTPARAVRIIQIFPRLIL